MSSASFVGWVVGIVALLGIFAFCMLISTPVAFALGISAIAAFRFEGLPLVIGFQRILSGINMLALIAIPVFIFAGELMFHGGIAIRCVRFAQAEVGAIPGLLTVIITVGGVLSGIFTVTESGAFGAIYAL